MLRKSIAAFLALLVVCVALSLPVAADVSYQSWCPNCGKFQAQGSITQHAYCSTCGTYLISTSMSGGDSRGAGAGRRPYEYWTTDSGSGNNHIMDGLSSSLSQVYQIINNVSNTVNFVVNNNTYNYTYNNYTYNNEYNYYTYNIHNGDNIYITNKVTYTVVSYPGDDGQYNNAILYYKLPDGRNSYNLTASDVWGTYFIYDVVNYEQVPEDDGVTLGLWHFDENVKDSSFIDNSSFSTLYDYVSSPFDSALNFPSTSNHVFSSGLRFPRDSFPLTFELRFKTDAPYFIFDFFSQVKDASTEDMVFFLGTNVRYFLVPISDTSVWHTISVVYHSWPGINFPVDCACDYMDNADSSHYSVYLDGHSVSNAVFDPTPFGYNFKGGVLLKRTSDSSGFDEFFICNSAISTRYTWGSFSYSLLLDEFRVTKGALYSSDYIPSSQPFDTNKILVLPSSGVPGNIAVKSTSEITGYRIGGVRPTFPTNGYVYVYLEDDVVKDVQQYQVNEWVSIQASIYDSGWVNLKDYDLSEYEEPAPEPVPTPSPSPGPDNPDNPDNPDDGKSIWDKLVDAVLGFFEVIGKILGAIVTGLVTLVTGAISQIGNLVNIFGDFGAAVASMYTWLPEDWQLVLGAAFSVVVIIAIISLIRK